MQLGDYLKETRVLVKDFAESIGVRRQAVHTYVTKKKRPSAETMQRIFEVTKGKVQPNDFYDLESSHGHH